MVVGGVTTAVTYGSDGLRRRTLVTNSDGTKTQTDSVYDNSMLVEEIVTNFDANGAQLGTPSTVTYMQGPQGPLYRRNTDSSDARWCVYDGLDLVVGEVDVDGNVTGAKRSSRCVRRQRGSC